MRHAFVASTALKPMARQLLADRTPTAYLGVENFARKHAAEDAGALAWLVIGYAHTLDHDYAKAIDPLNRAKLHAGDLGDYVAYYLGDSYLETGRTAEAVASVQGFVHDFPNSLLVRDAQLLYMRALLAEDQPDQAIAIGEKNREPVRTDLEFALGRAYAAAGQSAKAAGIFQNIYYHYPLAAEAPAADTELKKLGNVPPPSVADLKTRASLLMSGKRYSDAASAYEDLLDRAPDADKPELQLALADAFHKAGQNREAKKELDVVQPVTPENSAERIFLSGEVARGTNDDDAFLKNVDDLRQQAPTSSYLEQALLSAGNIYLLRKDYDRAIDSYRELQSRFPNAAKASYAHWKVAWLSLRQGRSAEAKKGFEDQIALYPNSGEVPAAVYWRGRLAEEDGDAAMARAYYVKLSLRFKNFYYGELARQRLAKLPAKTATASAVNNYAVLDHLPPIGAVPKAAEAVPADNLRVQKAHLLENGGLLDFAARELRAAAQEQPGNWLAPEIARMYQDAGRFDVAIETLKRAEPNYFAVDLPTLPREYWEALFPRAYWIDLKKFSADNSLDPFLVASLIRQESEFNPNAVSRANAVGLMQLLPKVGKGVAREEKLKRFSTSQLFQPDVNLRLGTRYFRGMVDKFGSFEYALAAYNAGSERVQTWLGDGTYRDPQEFVENIPFTETREYVEAILRNASVYRQLYGTP